MEVDHPDNPLLVIASGAKKHLHCVHTCGGCRCDGNWHQYVVKSLPLFPSVPQSAGRICANSQRIKDMIEPQDLPESQGPQVVKISQAQVEAVNAELVRLNQSIAIGIRAEDVALQQSAAESIRADSISAHQSALVAVKAEEVLSQRSAIGYVQAEKASVSGYTGAVVAGNAEVHYGLTGVAIGREVHVEGARALLVVGRQVSGNVTTIMDPRSALIAGLTGGLFAGLMFLLGRALFGRK